MQLVGEVGVVGVQGAWEAAATVEVEGRHAVLGLLWLCLPLVCTALVKRQGVGLMGQQVHAPRTCVAVLQKQEERGKGDTTNKLTVSCSVIGKL